jgi:hydroxyacylglutathione hydrolase
VKIKQFRYGRNNLGYLLYGKRQGLAIDGGAVEEMLEFIRLNGLVLKGITNTHGHGDHTCGNRQLQAESKAPLFEDASIRGKKRIELDGEFIEVLETPGHTADSVCFRTADILVTGDTLFNGTVGNCFSGDMQGFFASIKKLMRLPPETRVYAGHDYVRDSLAFAAKVEPCNRKVTAYLEKYDPAHVVSCLADELEVNPFLRFNQQSIMEELGRRGMKRSTEFDRWESLMWIE